MSGPESERCMPLRTEEQPERYMATKLIMMIIIIKKNKPERKQKQYGMLDDADEKQGWEAET